MNQETFDPRARDSSLAVTDYLRKSISLAEIAQNIWSGRIIVIVCLVIGLLFGTYSVWTAGPKFTAEVSLLPAESNSVEGNSSTSGALGLLAGLTGSNVGSAPKFTEFLAALHSTGVAEILDQKYAMSCRVFGGDCDQETHEWRRRTGTRAWFNGELAALQGLPDPNGPHTPAELAQYIEGSVIVTIDKSSPIVKLDFATRRPEFAAQFLTTLIKTTNDYIRLQDRSILRQYVGYLTSQASAATNVAQRDAFDQLLLQQERKLMLSEVDVPYAAAVLDGPTVLPVNSALKWIVAYGVLGALMGCALVLAGRSLKARLTKQHP